MAGDYCIYIYMYSLIQFCWQNMKGCYGELWNWKGILREESWKWMLARVRLYSQRAKDEVMGFVKQHQGEQCMKEFKILLTEEGMEEVCIYIHLFLRSPFQHWWLTCLVFGDHLNLLASRSDSSRVRMSPSRTGPFTLRMMERCDSSRNSTRTCVHWPWDPVRPNTFVTCMGE